MKTLFLLVNFLCLINCFGQKPEKVYSIVKELKSVEWYKKQSELWEKETKKHKKNAEAWYNYFSANRALKNIYWNDPEKLNTYFKICEQITKDAYKAVPNSFEANHLIWWHSFNDPTKFSYLEKAYEINPLDERTYRDLMTHYALKLNESKVKEFATKIFKVNEMPAALYNWAYNMLAEAEPNAIIFTGGDNDTYIPWIVQQVLGFRKDVTILNATLLQVKDYSEKLFNKMNIPAFDPKIDTIKTQADYDLMKKRLYQHVFDQNNEYPVYVSTTAIEQFKDEYEDKLYLVGLTYKYCEQTFDNIAFIKRNFEKRYLIDYLNENFSFHQLDKKSDDFNIHYLQAFIKLHKHYNDSEEFNKAKELRELIIKIAKRGEQEENLKEWINEYNK